MIRLRLLSFLRRLENTFVAASEFNKYVNAFGSRNKKEIYSSRYIELVCAYMKNHPFLHHIFTI